MSILKKSFFRKHKLHTIVHEAPEPLPQITPGLYYKSQVSPYHCLSPTPLLVSIGSTPINLTLSLLAIVHDVTELQ